jgi:hypothetical protein
MPGARCHVFLPFMFMQRADVTWKEAKPPWGGYNDSGDGIVQMSAKSQRQRGNKDHEPHTLTTKASKGGEGEGEDVVSVQI